MNAKTSISPNVTDKARRTRTLSLTGVLLLSVFLSFFRLGDRPFRNPDEGRYAVIAKEMVASDDWVRPTVFGLGYQAKPPLFYWLLSVSFKTFGQNEWTARAVPALFSVLGVLAVFLFAARFFGTGTAVLASVILAANPWFALVGRYLLLDSVFSFFLTAALFFFYAATCTEKRKALLFWMFYLFVALAFLVKGPAALACAGAAILLYLASTRRLGHLLKMRFFSGALLFLAVTLPWFWVMERREPGFLRHFILHEHFKRFVSPEFEHQEPWSYYLVMLPALFAPWSLLARPWRKLWNDRHQAGLGDILIFCLGSALAITVFYSLSRSKMPTYILPCLPFLSLAAGAAWKRWLDADPRLGKAEIAPVLFLMMAAIVVMAGSHYFVEVNAHKYPLKASEDMQWMGGACLASTVLCLRSIQRQRPRRLFGGLIVFLISVILLLPRVMETMNPVYSSRDFAAKLESRLDGHTPVYIYDHPGPFYDFSFYVKEPVRLVGLEGELALSHDDPRASEVSITRENFFQKILENEKLFVLMRRSDYEGLEPALREKLHPLKMDLRKVLLETRS